MYGNIEHSINALCQEWKSQSCRMAAGNVHRWAITWKNSVLNWRRPHICIVQLLGGKANMCWRGSPLWKHYKLLAKQYWKLIDKWPKVKIHRFRFSSNFPIDFSALTLAAAAIWMENWFYFVPIEEWNDAQWGLWNSSIKEITITSAWPRRMMKRAEQRWEIYPSGQQLLAQHTWKLLLFVFYPIFHQPHLSWCIMHQVIKLLFTLYVCPLNSQITQQSYT